MGRTGGGEKRRKKEVSMREQRRMRRVEESKPWKGKEGEGGGGIRAGLGEKGGGRG